MSADACPRCGADRFGEEACPSCGYEAAHPGVLGAFAQGARTVAKHPAVLVAFLAPVVVFALTRAAVLQFDADPASASPSLLVAELLAGLLQLTWFHLAVAAVTPIVLSRATRPCWPTGAASLACVAAASIQMAPIAVLAGLLLVPQEGAVGAVALLGVPILALVAFWLAGRMVAVPVEAAMTTSTTRQAVARGNRRGKENGGLGLVFLASLVLILLPLSLAVIRATAAIQLSPWTVLAVASLLTWPLGAWLGTSFVHGLAGRGEGEAIAFQCPRCGEQAIGRQGRARCACGLEGPLYLG